MKRRHSIGKTEKEVYSKVSTVMKNTAYKYLIEFDEAIKQDGDV